MGTQPNGDTGERMPVLRSVPDFGSFYRSEYSAVATLTMVLTRDRGSAEDITQDAFLKAHKDWARIGYLENPEGWVRRVATNLAMSRFRRIRAEARALLRLRSSHTPSTMSPEATEFWAEVRRLPLRQAQVVALHYVEDRSVEDIADLLDVSAGSVKTHLHRARQALADRFGSREEAP